MTAIYGGSKGGHCKADSRKWARGAAFNAMMQVCNWSDAHIYEMEPMLLPEPVYVVLPTGLPMVLPMGIPGLLPTAAVD
eukprot:578693-Rhodomonas_salina.1